tara:strand:+ start:8810 stop:11017 length:2208 start_codon:yes stop_codon:yes gene_type:complete
MKIVGYSDRLSVRPGQTIKFMVSCEASSYRAEIVRLRHTDDNPNGPGFKTEKQLTSIEGKYKGHYQPIHTGSYASISHDPLLNCTNGFTIQSWIFPTTPKRGVQGILTKFSRVDESGYGLYIDENGSLSLWLGSRENLIKVGTGSALQERVWYFVAASYDPANNEVQLFQKQQTQWPDRKAEASIRKSVHSGAVNASQGDLLIGASRTPVSMDSAAQNHFNGKIDNPRIYSCVIEDIGKELTRPVSVVGNWDFSLDISSNRISDTGPNGFHGILINLPTRAVTGHNWNGNVSDFNVEPSHYAAIHFHDDDLEDARWDLGFEWKVPENFLSGVYSVHLETEEEEEDYVTFFVVPVKPHSRIAFLVPTLTYQVYANHRYIDLMRAMLEREGIESNVPEDKYMKKHSLLSGYDLHSDGSGVCYSSQLRPFLNFRPRYRMPSQSLAAFSPRHLNSDMHLLHWLDNKSFDYDIITDHELHSEGSKLLSSYRVILTGSHPEYWTSQMLEAMELYQTGGGRLMYLGGNGFYWVTSFDPERPHIVEVRRWRGTRAWEAAPGECFHSTTGEIGGIWRFRNREPQKMVGVGFTAQGSGENRPYIRKPDSLKDEVAFIFDGVGEDELIGDFPALVLEHGAGGFEIDRLDHIQGTPKHALLLASAGGFSDTYQITIEDQLCCNPNTGGSRNAMVRSDMIYMEGQKGGATFSVGSISWCSCLSYNGSNNNVSQITENVLRRFSEDSYS